MADLNKLLVKVPANLCDAFRTKYLTGDGSTPRDTSYDKKIVFLEDTKDIFSQGKIYGTSYADFTQLQNKVNERSVTLTFNVNSFDKINEQGGNGSNAQLHYDAVYKAYENGGIVKIELDHADFEISPENNNTKSAILSNIKKVPGIDAFGNNMTYFTGTLCSNSIDGFVGNSKSYDITFKYIIGDATYGRGYYVSCKEIADTLYNRKFGGGKIQGDTDGTFMEMIDPGNDTLSIVLKQLLTNDVLIKKSLEPVEIEFPGVDYSSFGDIDLIYYDNGSDQKRSHVKDKFDKVKDAYAKGKLIKIKLINMYGSETEPMEAILSNLEYRFTSSFDIYNGLLCPPYTSSKSFKITFAKQGSEYKIKCTELPSLGTAAYVNTSYFDAYYDKAGAAASAAAETLEQANIYVQDISIALTGRTDDESSSLSIRGTRKYAKELADTAYSDAKDYTNSVLPTISAGNNINIVPTPDANGKINYEVSTTATVFNYKGNKEKFDQLPQLKTENKTGDVWSVGTADTPGSSLYAWDGDEWINIGPADGVVGIDPTSSHGISLTLNKNGYLGITAQNGFIGTDDRFVTGETVNSALGNIQREIPHLTYGRGINVSEDTLNGHFAYTVSTTSDMLRYIGSYNSYSTYTNDFPSFNFTPLPGDAYSLNRVLYCYTGDGLNPKWEPIVGRISDITHASVNGIRLTLNNIDCLGLSIEEGKIGAFSEYGTENVVTGGKVYKYIESLNDTKSGDGSYIRVTVSTQGGNVSRVEVLEDEKIKNAVTYANSALQSVEILGKTLNNTTNTLTASQVKSALGLGSAAYKNESDFDKAGAAVSAAAAVEKKLPAVVANTNDGYSGIAVKYSSDTDGKVTYTLSTTGEIFRYKGDVASPTYLRGGTEGDVYSINKSVLYRYDGSWSKIVGYIQSINTTAVNGVALSFADENFEGALGLSVTTGKVSASQHGDGKNLVRGYDVYEALCTYTIKDVISDDTLVIPENYTSYIKTEKRKYTDSSYSYTAITLNMSRVYSYVIDNIWEEFSLS